MGFNLGRVIKDANNSYQQVASYGMLGGKKSKGSPFPDSSNIPQFAMRKTSDFNQNNPNIQIGGPNGEQNLKKSFNALREGASNRANAANQGSANAIQRKFASIGASGSGAEIKAMQNAQDQAQALGQEANANIDVQEQQAFSNRDLAQADMDFKSRVFNFDQASKMHELDLAERGQKIGAAESEYTARVNAFANQPKKGGLLGGMLDGLL